MDHELQIGLKAYWLALGYQAERCCLSSNVACWCMLLHHRRIENKDFFFFFYYFFNKQSELRGYCPRWWCRYFHSDRPCLASFPGYVVSLVPLVTSARFFKGVDKPSPVSLGLGKRNWALEAATLP